MTAAAALPNFLAPDELRVRPDGDGRLVIDPQRAGWRHLSFRTEPLAAGGAIHLGSERSETVVILIAGGDVTADLGARQVRLAGRTSVFDGLPSAIYLPPGAMAQLSTSSGCMLAVAEAPASGRAGVSADAVVIGPEDVRVEVRGAGNATRQINHIIAPDFPADRLEVVEVFTPSGNWSSWPPHKHDTDDMPREAVLEEIYYYQLRRPEGWGIQRLYRADGSRDALWAVRHGELVLVTDGYHPFAAAHGYDAYYLNALAGDRRTMACSYDPDLDWIRDSWTDMEPDPRVPLVGRGS